MPTSTFSSAPSRGERSFLRQPGHRWRVLGVGVAANVSFSAAAAGIPTTALWLRGDYRLDNGELGLVLGALGLGVAISELPWGLATDRWGDRPILLGGLAGTALALLLMATCVVPAAGITPALAWLVSTMCLVGLCGGSVNGASGRAVMRWFAAGERGLAMSIRQTAVPLGGGLGALLLPWLAASHGFAAVYGVLAGLCAVTTAFAWRWLHEPPARHGQAGMLGSHGASGPWRDRQVWRLAVAIGVLCIPQFAVLTFATIFLHDAAGLELAGMSACMVAIQGGAMVMRIWSGRLTDRLDNRRAYLRGSTLVAVAAFLLLAAAAGLGSGGAASRFSLLALLVFAGVAVSAWHGVAYTELAVQAGAERAGTALGMANTLVYFALFVTPLAIPYLLAVSSWAGVWLVAALCALLTYPLFPRPLPG